MVNKTTGLLLALAGVLTVLLLALVYIDARASARRGPRWWRRLIASGIACLGLLLGAGSRAATSQAASPEGGRAPVLGQPRDGAAGADSVARDRRPMCYRPARRPDARPTIDQITSRLVLLEKMAAKGKVEVPVVCKAAKSLGDVLRNFRRINIYREPKPARPVLRRRMRTLKLRVKKLRGSALAKQRCLARAIDGSKYWLIDLSRPKWEASEIKAQKLFERIDPIFRELSRAEQGRAEICRRAVPLLDKARKFKKALDRKLTGHEGDSDADSVRKLVDRLNSRIRYLERECGLRRNEAEDDAQQFERLKEKFKDIGERPPGFR